MMNTLNTPLKKSLMQQLQESSPKKRALILKKNYQKNRQYFKNNHSGIHKFLQDNKSPYHVSVTDDFIEIKHVSDPQKSCSGESLLKYTKDLGNWAHQGWIDLIDPLFRHYAHGAHYSQLVEDFRNGLLGVFSDFGRRFSNKQVNLAPLADGTKFSNPVVFAGIFHGLHIDYYLSRTDVRMISLIEPEPERFEISCYFLDYTEIHKKYGVLLLHIGPELPNHFVNTLVLRASISTPSWLRILPNYISEPVKPLIKQLQLRWSLAYDEWIPAIQELDGFRSGTLNLQAGRPMLLKVPEMSSSSRIAVVGAGPSLASDVNWLKENKEKLIIFAAHSAVRILLQNGIRPDFQFCLDLEIPDDSYERLSLRPEIPMIFDYRVKLSTLQRFEKPLLVAPENETGPAKIHFTLSEVLPTTGNLAVAVASFCAPDSMYLLGLDFGFRQKEKSHVAGGFYDDHEGLQKESAGEDQILTPANFPETDPVFTRAYFNNARVRVERKLRELSETKVYNLSDGAAIQGAEPRCSHQIELPVYAEKQQDMTTILQSFRPPIEGVDWTPYTKSGGRLLNQLKSQLTEELRLSSFNWSVFSKRVDSLQFILHQQCQSENSDDLRMIPYLRIIKDLLRTWYQFMIFTNNYSEAEHIYQKGIELIQEAAGRFEWPES